FRSRMVANPMRWFHYDVPGLIVEARSEIARFIEAEPDDTALVLNVTTGVSAVLASFPLKPGDQVVTTDHIYGAVSIAVDQACQRSGAERVVARFAADADDDQVLAAVAGCCGPNTRLVVIDHVTSATAKLLPVEALAAMAHERGAAILVDAAHAIGMLPVDVPAIGADFWTANLHKWPCAPAGTGVLWVAPEWQDRVQPTIISHSFREGFPTAFDRMGTNDLSAWLAAPVALRMLDSLDWKRVRTHNEALVDWAQHHIADALGMPEGALRHDPGLSLALVPLPAGVAETREGAQALQGHLASRGVEMVVPRFREQTSIRLSAHVYNSPRDYERLAAGVVEYLHS
ncbi:MAG TPA: aminotransferase class V-fold PLP-dependent enzyme, partial [Acidimicrobiales bacterium]|nr:aminotransferase class V-fold PLP-dependent enzyme [Acidimicrobiales bacterium]